MKKEKYTLEDIAEELHLDKSTVSRAISGKGRVSEATREKVLAFAREHHYTPNIQAKGLSSGKTYNLGIVLPEDYGNTGVQFFRDCMKGVAVVAEYYNYDLLMLFASNQHVSSIERVIANHKVDGVIIGRLEANSFAQQLLEENHIPFVVMGQTADQRILSIDNPNYEACAELTEILLMKGNKRLALFGGGTNHWATKKRYMGFLDAHKKQGAEVNPLLVFLDIDTFYKAERAVRQTMETGADGIVCMDDFIAELVLRCLREEKILVPEQMKLASFYDSREMENSIPPITSVRFDSLELGKNACALLLEQLGETITKRPNTLNYQVVLRKSTN